MLLRVDGDLSEAEVNTLREAIEVHGLRTRRIGGADPPLLLCLGAGPLPSGVLAAWPGVGVVRTSPDPPLAGRVHEGQRTVIPLPGTARVGGQELVVIAGPCAVESRCTLEDTAAGVMAAGATALRGGAYKPRTSPYAFQGLGEAGLELLAEVRARTGLPVVTEVMDPRLVDRVCQVADVLQIGARNMQNYPLLEEVGRVRRPVLLKRGLAASLEEMILGAERIMAAGNGQVILCERGIRTYETATRNTLDVSAVAVLKERTHLPVIVDPSHAAGRRELVPSLALAAVAAGADGLIVEVHADPGTAASDGRQSLDLAAFAGLMVRVRSVAAAVGRSLPGGSRASRAA